MLFVLRVPQLGGLANELCAKPPDDLLLASGIPRQSAFGSASRSLELA
jgi:hypothetical protein